MSERSSAEGSHEKYDFLDEQEQLRKLSESAADVIARGRGRTEAQVEQEAADYEEFMRERS